jgi:hypothetical protein
MFVEPLPMTWQGLDQSSRRHLSQLLSSNSYATVVAAVEDRDAAPLGPRLLALGARLAMDSWQEQPWTQAVLEWLTGMPSQSWRSVLIGVDSGLKDAAWTLSCTLDDAGRRALLAVGHPGLAVVAAAGLPGNVLLPADLEPNLASLIQLMATLRDQLGDVPPPWSPRFMEHDSLSAEGRATLGRLAPAIAAAGIVLPEEPEIERVLACELAEGDEDWVVYTLDAIAAEIAHELEPTLRGALPAAIRNAWSAEWHLLAQRLVEQIHAP